MKRWLLAGFVLVCAGLQLGFWPFVRPFGVVPQMLLVVMVLTGLNLRIMTSLVLALASGLMVDVSSSTSFGLWTGMLVLTVLVGALVRQAGIETDQLLVPVAIIAAGTLMLDVAVWLGMATLVSRWPVGELAGTFLLELMLNLIIMTLVRPFVRWSADGPMGE